MKVDGNISHERKEQSTVSKHILDSNTGETIAEIVGRTKREEEVWEELEKDGELRRQYEALTKELRQEFLAFAMGKSGLKITYDSVFKKIFDPGLHPERLEELLGSLLKQKVKLLRVIPNESSRLTAEGSLLIMDILIQLETGELVNVEIQRMGYLFPGARCACYSSDLVMRQYSQVREECRRRKKRFSYQAIKKVYTIVLIEESTAEFWKYPKEYLHYAKQVFNTGLQLDMLQEYVIIPLDIFKQNLQNVSIRNKAEAWLYFVSSDNMEDIEKVIDAYPEFVALYREVFQFRDDMKELISMYSEALAVLDANTVQYMIELQKKELEKKEQMLEEKDRELELQKRECARLRALLEAREK